MVEREQVRPHACFHFETGDRRVISVENGQVQWIYADGKKRHGKTGGYQRVKHFANEATEEYQESVMDTIRSAPRRGHETGLYRNPLFIITYIGMSALIIYFVLGTSLFN